MRTAIRRAYANFYTHRDAAGAGILFHLLRCIFGASGMIVRHTYGKWSESKMSQKITFVAALPFLPLFRIYNLRWINVLG
jgi:hypothetical protein